MEPNNIENQFRDTLNQREINPSENAWDRLDAMLTVAEKPKRNYGWLYIAASFLGFLLVATVFFSQTEELIDVKKNQTVGRDTPIQAGKEDANSESIQQVDSIAVNEGNTAVAVEIKLSKHKEVPIKIKEEIPVNDPKTNQEQIAENSIINQKTEQKEVVQKPAYIDVDALLASVEKPGKSEKLFVKKSEVRVNPNSLLSQVDGELELSFREKVINTVNKNYKTVKVALSNRNKE